MFNDYFQLRFEEDGPRRPRRMDHRKPIIKYEFPQEKKNEVESSDDEEINEKLSHLASILSSRRLALRSDRKIGIWDPLRRIVALEPAIKKNPENTEFRNASNHLLQPLEALYLMEMNRLEIVEDEITWSMYKAYTTLLSSKTDMEKYVVYKKHLMEGSSVELVPADKLTEVVPKEIKHDIPAIRLDSDPVASSSDLQCSQIEQQLKVQGPKVYNSPRMDKTSETNEEWILNTADGTRRKLNWMSVSI